MNNVFTFAAPHEEARVMQDLKSAILAIPAHRREVAIRDLIAQFPECKIELTHVEDA